MTRRRSAHGYSLLELTVASAVMMLGLWLAADLLTESARRFAEAGREVRQPVASLTERLLRQDLEAAAGVAGGPAAAMGQALVLTRPDGERLTWRLDGTTLTRTVTAADGSERASRPVLTGVLFFLWRETFPGLVEVDLAWESERFSPYRAATARWRERRPAIASARLLVALRGAGRGLQW